MEKLGRGAKAPSMPTPQQPPVTPRKERRPSMFEKEAYAQILRERLRESVHDVQYVEPPFGDSIADLGTEWKTALAKLKVPNSYRMEPRRKPQARSVEAKVQQMLKESLQDVKYDDKVFSHLSLELADRILSSVKEFGYHRYKFIIKVLFIQKTGQAINFQPSGDAAGPEVPDSLAHSRDRWFPCTEAIVLQRRNGVLTQGSSQHSRGESRRLPKASLGSCTASHYFAQGKSQDCQQMDLGCGVGQLGFREA